jgi:hypothetical protein
LPADGSLAGVATRTDVATRAAVVRIGLKVDTDEVAVRRVRLPGVLRDFDVLEWVRLGAGAMTDADLLVLLRSHLRAGGFPALLAASLLLLALALLPTAVRMSRFR